MPSPPRLISLNCSNTEIVHALGCAHYLVAVDDDSDYPTEVVRNLPRVGRDLDIDVEKVGQLAPDLVLASLTVPGHERTVANLTAANLPFLAPEPISLVDVMHSIRDIGAALGVAQRAAKVVDQMQEAMPSQPASQRSMLVQWWPKPVIAPGRLSWIHDMLHHLGVRNPLQEREVKSMPLDDYEVAQLDPDIIVLAWCGVATMNYRPQKLYANPVLKDVAAVRQAQIYSIPEAYLGRPSPRLCEGYRALQHVLHHALG